MKYSIKVYIISLSVFVSISLFMHLYFKNYIIEKYNEGYNNNIVNTTKYIKKSINFVIHEKKDTYIKLANIIFSNQEILNALENKDRDKFYTNIKEYYKRAKQRDADFWGLHIILPDNLSFIRVHKSHVADKLIDKGKKPSIDKVNLTRNVVTNFEAGKFGYFLRVNVPIFSKENKYLGVAEFSVNLDSLTQYIKDNFDYEALILVENKQNKKFLERLPKSNDGLILFKSTNNVVFKNINIKVLTNHEKNNLLHSYIYTKNNTYNTVVTILSKTASLFTAFDITSYIKGKNDFYRNINFLFYITTFVFFPMWFFATKLYIKNKKYTNYKLKRFDTIISTHVNYTNTNLDGKITDASHEFCRIFEYSLKELIGASHNIIKHPSMDKLVYKDLWDTINKGNIWKGEMKNLSKNGTPYWFFTTISPLHDENDVKIGYSTVRENITNKKIIEQLSITDGLTGLFNRRHFDISGPKIINQIQRDDKYLSFLMLDIDHFKLYNDTYGHVQGDVVIKAVADAMKIIYKRNCDNAFRIGGEEFVILTSSPNNDGLIHAEKLLEYIYNLNILHEKNKNFNRITVSAGLVNIKPDKNANMKTIYQIADEQLYKSKKNGRNQINIA